MSYFTKNRIRNWLLIFLVVTNIATISTIYYHRWRFKHLIHKTDTHRRLKDFINEELKFTQEQKKSLEDKKKILGEKKDSIYDKLENIRISVYNEFAKSLPDSLLIDSIASQTGIAYAEIDKASVLQYHFLFSICNKEQKIKLGKFFKNMADEIVNEMKEDNCRKKDDNCDQK